MTRIIKDSLQDSNTVSLDFERLKKAVRVGTVRVYRWRR